MLCWCKALDFEERVNPCNVTLANASVAEHRRLHHSETVITTRRYMSITWFASRPLLC